MNLTLRQEDAHPSSFSIQGYLAGELDEAAHRAIEAHLQDCPRCREVHAALLAGREAFHAGHDRATFLAAVAAGAASDGGRWSWLRTLSGPRLLLSAGGAAAALVVLVASFWIFAPRPAQDDGIRMKGEDLRLSYLVEVHGRPVLASPGRVLHPGDRIQFRLTAPKGGYVHLVGVDEAGQLSLYFPGPGQRVEPFPGGAGRPLPTSVILDDTLGRERVFALVCTRPLKPDRLRQKLKSGQDDLRVWIDRTSLPIDCLQTSLMLVKE